MTSTLKATAALTALSVLASSAVFAQATLSDSEIRDSASGANATANAESLQLIRDHLADLEKQLDAAETNLVMNRGMAVAGIALSGVMVYFLTKAAVAPASDINLAVIRAVGGVSSVGGALIGAAGAFYANQQINVNKEEIASLRLRIDKVKAALDRAEGKVQ